MRTKEPFSYARNLKIFIIVLCCLPLVGIAMMIFLPTPANGVTVELVPHSESSQVEFDTLLEEIENPGTATDSEAVRKAMVELVGEIGKTYSIAPAVIATENRVFFVNPFNNGVENTVGVELFVFEYEYGYYEEEDFGLIFLSAPDLSKFGTLSENERFGAMNFNFEYVNRYLFNYNYNDYTVSYFSGNEKLVDINRIEIDLTEDSVTDRVINTVYAESAVCTNENGLLNADDIEILSRIIPGGFKNTEKTEGTSVLTKTATSDNNEKGAYLRVKTAEKSNDLAGFIFNILNIEKDKYDEEMPHPAFKIEMKIYFTNVEEK